jgi:hypothetical protein
VDPTAPPPELDARIDWFENFSYALVLLAEFPLGEVGAAVRAFEVSVREHLRDRSLEATPTSRLPAPLRETWAVLAADHAWFVTSIDQLEWSYAIVEGEDHGGHRQALGQYGRVFAEALRRHRAEERAFWNALGRVAADTPRKP